MNQTQDLIIHAANALLRRSGVERFTISAVAQEANLSKGGVLYHFASKSSLITALVKALVMAFEHQRDKFAQQDERSQGRFARSYIYGTLAEHHAHYSGGLLAALAHEPEHLAPLREAYVRWQHQLEDDLIDPVYATIIRLAMDGLWMAQVLDLPSLKPQLQVQVIEELLKMCQGEPNEPK